jgi:hypothetical protein
MKTLLSPHRGRSGVKIERLVVKCRFPLIKSMLNNSMVSMAMNFFMRMMLRAGSLPSGTAAQLSLSLTGLARDSEQCAFTYAAHDPGPDLMAAGVQDFFEAEASAVGKAGADAAQVDAVVGAADWRVDYAEAIPTLKAAVAGQGAGGYFPDWEIQDSWADAWAAEVESEPALADYVSHSADWAAGSPAVDALASPAEAALADCVQAKDLDCGLEAKFLWPACFAAGHYCEEQLLGVEADYLVEAGAVLIPSLLHQTHGHLPDSLRQWMAHHDSHWQIGFCPDAWPADDLPVRWWVGYAFHS